MAEHPDQTVDDLRRQLDELRSENDRLRGLLGLDGRSADAHQVEPSPSLFAQLASPPPAVTAASTNVEKLALFKALFGARSDAYAVRWESASKGKAGWSPAVRGGWVKKRPTKDDFLPLTDEVLAIHLRGAEHHGIYPLLHGDLCELLVCDFDRGSWALDALAYLDACTEAGVPAAFERSRSGNGAHVWIFFDGPVQASVARSMGASLLRAAMCIRAELDLASYDRFFPSQDFMPKGSFGNLIALPLQGERAKDGNTLFLDPTTMKPWPDQWAFLSSLRRLRPDEISAVAEQLRPVDAGPSLSIRDLIRAGGPPPPPVIRAQLAAMLSVDRAGVPPALIAALKHLASLHNPEFHEKQRMRFSTWDTPRFIKCYEEDLQWLHLPRGLAEKAGTLVDDAGSHLEIEDRRPEHDPLDLSFNGTLRAGQGAALAAVQSEDYAVLVAPPGAGKTVMACAAIAHHQVPTLVLVDRKPLVDQWRVRLEEHLGLEPAQLGQIGGGKTEPSGVVDVAMLQTIARHEDSRSLFARYGLVVVDECHHLPAVSFDTCVRHAPVKRWLGLTATPYRRDGLEESSSSSAVPPATRSPSEATTRRSCAST